MAKRNILIGVGMPAAMLLEPQDIWRKRFAGLVDVSHTSSASNPLIEER
jgi:hypothetical protein